jgi:hypothetical protein
MPIGIFLMKPLGFGLSENYTHLNNEIMFFRSLWKILKNFVTWLFSRFDGHFAKIFFSGLRLCMLKRMNSFKPSYWIGIYILFIVLSLINIAKSQDWK